MFNLFCTLPALPAAESQPIPLRCMVKQSITEYPYLEGKIDCLTSDYPVDKLAEIIVQILDSVLSSKY